MWEIQPEKSEKWYKHVPEGVVENGEVKIFWDVMIHCDSEIKPREADIVAVNKNERSAIINILITGDIRFGKNKKAKIEKHQELKREIKRI